MTELVEGRTATGPNGQKLIVRGGKLVPMTANGAAPLPAPRFDPVAGIGKQGAGRMANEEGTLIDEAFKDARRLDGIVGQAAAFGNLNRRTGTGGILAMPVAQNALAAFNSDVADMRSINSALAPTLRQPGAGAMSDKDLAIFQASIPNLAAPGNANKAIRDRYAAAQQRANDYVAFLQEYQAQYGNGSLREARRLWQQYASQERLYDESGRIRQVRPWQEYFGTAPARPAPRQAPAPAPRPQQRTQGRAGGNGYRILSVE